MVLQKYKIDLIFELVYFIILGPFLQIIYVEGLILMTKIFRSPYFPYLLNPEKWGMKFVSLERKFK